jgi:hypothetical protein
MRRLWIVAMVVSSVGCGGDHTDDADHADAGPNDPDARPGVDGGGADSAGGCAQLPSTSPSWLGAYQDDIVARLSGQTPISPGVTLADRANGARRAATADYLEATLNGVGLAATRHAYGTGTNVYAELPGDGTVAGRIVLGAHYDSVSGSPGANDNATGVALVMAVARYLRDVECRRRGVIVVFFDQEEVGLVGSAAFAQKLVDDGTNVAAVHTVDQMGWDDDGDRAIELERADTGLYQQYAAGKQGGGFSMALTPTQTGSTDHVSFRDKGFDAVGITEEYVSGDTTPHYHLPGDRYATVNFAYLASTTALVSYTLASVARGELAALAPLVGPMPAPLPGRER